MTVIAGLVLTIPTLETRWLIMGMAGTSPVLTGLGSVST
jgi:hypothetical protein